MLSWSDIRERFFATWRPLVGVECAEALWQHRLRAVACVMAVFLVIVVGPSTIGDWGFLVAPLPVFGIWLSSAFATPTWARHCGKKLNPLTVAGMQSRYFEAWRAREGVTFSDEPRSDDRWPPDATRLG